jgi:general secretion pathway protein N
VSRTLILLDLLFAGVIAAAGLYVAREVRATQRPAAPVHRPPASPTPAARPAAAAATSTETYGVVVSRTLFNPARSDRAVSGVATAPTAPPLVKPSLLGVVLRDGAPVAYLEDPATKRVVGYRLGDTIAGGSVSTIAADHVVIARPDGNVDVRLHDPARPRPAAPPGAPGAPASGGPPVPASGSSAAAPTPATGEAPSPTPPGATAPGVVPPVAPPGLPTRRAIPPNVPRPAPND